MHGLHENRYFSQIRKLFILWDIIPIFGFAAAILLMCFENDTCYRVIIIFCIWFYNKCGKNKRLGGKMRLLKTEANKLICWKFEKMNLFTLNLSACLKWNENCYVKWVQYDYTDKLQFKHISGSFVAKEWPHGQITEVRIQKYKSSITWTFFLASCASLSIWLSSRLR